MDRCAGMCGRVFGPGPCSHCHPIMTIRCHSSGHMFGPGPVVQLLPPHDNYQMPQLQQRQQQLQQCPSWWQHQQSCLAVVAGELTPQYLLVLWCPLNTRYLCLCHQPIAVMSTLPSQS